MLSLPQTHFMKMSHLASCATNLNESKYLYFPNITQNHTEIKSINYLYLSIQKLYFQTILCVCVHHVHIVHILAYLFVFKYMTGTVWIDFILYFKWYYFRLNAFNNHAIFVYMQDTQLLEMCTIWLINIYIKPTLTLLNLFQYGWFTTSFREVREVTALTDRGSKGL